MCVLKVDHLTAWKVPKYGVFSGPNTRKYGPGKTPYLDCLRAVTIILQTIVTLYFQVKN